MIKQIAMGAGMLALSFCSPAKAAERVQDNGREMRENSNLIDITGAYQSSTPSRLGSI